MPGHALSGGFERFSDTIKHAYMVFGLSSSRIDVTRTWIPGHYPTYSLTLPHTLCTLFTIYTVSCIPNLRNQSVRVIGKRAKKGDNRERKKTAPPGKKAQDKTRGKKTCRPRNIHSISMSPLRMSSSSGCSSSLAERYSRWIQRTQALKKRGEMEKWEKKRQRQPREEKNEALR